MLRSVLRGPVLVTGGAGYIGSHVCKALAAAGAQPVCLDSLEKGHEWAVRWGDLARGDVGDEHRETTRRAERGDLTARQAQLGEPGAHTALELVERRLHVRRRQFLDADFEQEVVVHFAPPFFAGAAAVSSTGFTQRARSASSLMSG